MSLTLTLRDRVHEAIEQARIEAVLSLASAPAKSMEEYLARVAGIQAYQNCINILGSVWDDMNGNKQQGAAYASANGETGGSGR